MYLCIEILFPIDFKMLRFILALKSVPHAQWGIDLEYHVGYY